MRHALTITNHAHTHTHTHVAYAQFAVTLSLSLSVSSPPVFLAAVKQKYWCKLRGNLLFYLKDKNPKSTVAGVFVLEDCRIYTLHEQLEVDEYGFDLGK